MKSFKLKIPSTEGEKNDLTIIYIEGSVTTHEIKTRGSKFLKALRYFQKKSIEINQTKVVYIQEDISFDLFSNFIASIKKKEIDINEHNYEQYYYLSSKYEYTELKTEIEQFIRTRPDINLLINQLLTSNTLKNEVPQSPENSMKEEIIAKNLDASIQIGNLKHLPLDILNRILLSPKKVVKNHHSLFVFITSLIKEKVIEKLSDEERENLYLLPSSLDYSQMDNDEIIELFEIVDKNEFFMPQKAEKRMKMLIESEKKREEENLMLKKQIESIEENFKKHVNEIELKLKKTEKKLTDIIKNQEESIVKTKNQLDLHEKEAKEQQKNIENSFKMQIDSIKDKINETETRLIKNSQTHEENLKKIKKEIDEEKQKKQKEIDEKIFTFEHQNGKDFQGIMKFLTDKIGGNIHNNKIIEITTNSDYVNNNENSSYHPKTLVDYSKTDNIYYDSTNKDAKICFDFKDKRIQLSSYSVKSHQNGPGNGHLRNWIIEVSNDGKFWETVDSRINDGTLNGSNIIATFNVNQSIEPNSFYRYVQLRQTGISWYGGNHYDIFFYLIEFYGKLKFP